VPASVTAIDWFLQVVFPFCCPTNSVGALKGESIAFCDFVHPNLTGDLPTLSWQLKAGSWLTLWTAKSLISRLMLVTNCLHSLVWWHVCWLCQWFSYLLTGFVQTLQSRGKSSSLKLKTSRSGKSRRKAAISRKHRRRCGRKMCSSAGIIFPTFLVDFGPHARLKKFLFCWPCSYYLGCTDNALADYRSADNRCQTIGRLPINTKSSRNRTKARSSHRIIQHWRWTRAGWREGWRGEGLRCVVDHWPVTTRAAHPSPRQWRHPSHVTTDGRPILT